MRIGIADGAEASLREAMRTPRRLSTQRPIAPFAIGRRPTCARSSPRKRGFEERPWAGAETGEWARAHGQSPYDGSAGFPDKWEHAFAGLAEAEGIGFDYLNRLRLTPIRARSIRTRR